MNYLSVASGIESATVAWHPLGWMPVAFAQFDPEHRGKGRDFASAVLHHHYPGVPNLGDMTKFEEWPDAAVDVLAGGTPCQSFSVAGLRAGLDDERGSLMLVYGAIARKYRPKWLVWENVPGVLSDDGGRSFASLLGLLSGRRVEVPSGGWQSAGIVVGYSRAYGLAWRVLDSQFVRVDGFERAVPQRRRRVFVVGYLGDWRRAAAVLFERASMCGDPPPRRKSGQDVAPTISARTSGGGGLGTDFDCDGGLIPETVPTLGESSGHARLGDNIQSVGYLLPEVANPLTARMFKGVNTTMNEGRTMIGEPMAFKASHFTRGKDGAPDVVVPPLSADADRLDQDTLLVFDETQITHPENRSQPRPGQPSPALASGARPPTIAFSAKDSGGDAAEDVSPTLRAGGFTGSHANGGIMPAVAFQARLARNGRGAPADVGYPLTAGAGRSSSGDSAQLVQSGWVVRRLTPEECERLQGFPTGYTNIPWRGKSGAPDGPRYKVLGNAMSVNVMRWIGRRIEMVDKIAK